MLGDGFAGVSCDRGWAQLFNPLEDDGISHCDAVANGRCRSLLFSQRSAMATIAPIFHAAGKLISYNPSQIPRVDLMEHYDAIFTELSMTSLPNVWLIAAMSLSKPATMWTTKPPTDMQFENMLLHGVYPMAPSPVGDHSLSLAGLPAFLEYGPMFRALRGREWDMRPHAIHVFANSNFSSSCKFVSQGLGYAEPAGSNRRCGTCCGASDMSSPMCVGATAGGELYVTDEVVQARCAVDDTCKGYSRCTGARACDADPTFGDSYVRPITDISRVVSTDTKWETFEKVCAGPVSAEANIFRLTDGSLIAPIIVQGGFPGGSGDVESEIQLPKALLNGADIYCEVLQKGRQAKWTLLADTCSVADGVLSALVTVHSGIAMLRISVGSSEAKMV